MKQFRCPEPRHHDLYSCPLWREVLAAGGRVPHDTLGGFGAELPYFRVKPTQNPNYELRRLLGVDKADRALWWGGPMSAYRTDLVRETASPKGLGSVFRELAAISSAHDADAVVPYIPSYALPSGSGGTHTLTDYEYCMALNGNMDAYLSRLPSKRRTSVRRELKAFFGRGLTLDLRPLSEFVPAMAGFAVDHSRRYGISEDVNALGTFLSNIARVFGENALIFAASLSGEMVGGTFGIAHNDTLYMRMTGQGTRVLEGSFSYFVMTYYAPFIFSDRLPLSCMNLGLGSGSTKMSRGAAPQALYTWSTLDVSDSPRVVRGAQ